MNSKKIVTRFAPSPTGFMHIGGARTALYAWLYARKHKGTFILRIEDTDKQREVEGSINHIIEALRWLGIEWDEGPDVGGPHGPYLQSERLESHRKYAQILVDKGFAYADPYTEEEVEVFRKKAEEEGKPFLYRNHRPENPPIWDGTQPLRFKVKDIKSYEWEDLVRGKLSAGPEALDDFILIKQDGYPTYNFAHIIDDLEMGVTHIMRTDEFISSTPKFLSLYEALEIKRPEIAILPPIMAPDGKKKLGKRDGAKDSLDYRNEGYLPEAMMNFLAFIGWNPGGEKEVYTKDELIEAFSISKIHSSGGKFNEEKLKWFNREHMKRLSDEDFLNKIEEFLPTEIKKGSRYQKEMIVRMLPLLRDKLSYFGELNEMHKNGELEYFFNAPTQYDKNLLIWKELKNESTKEETTKQHISRIVKYLEALSPVDWNADMIKSIMWPYAEEHGRGNVFWPIRVSLSGREKSPDPFILAFILGKDETLKRLQFAHDLL